MMQRPAWLWLPRSLKLVLLRLLLPGLIGMLAIDTVSAYQALCGVTDRTYDRALLGSVYATGNGVTIECGQVQVNVPYVALSMLESAVQGNVYYRVAFEPLPGKAPEAALIGYGDLPLPVTRLESGTPLLYGVTYHDEPVRATAVVKLLYQPRLLACIAIQVAETIKTRRALQRAVWHNALLHNAALVAVSAMLLWPGVTVTLQPLNHLTRDIDIRASDDLHPLDATDVPAEVRPLVDAINHHIYRYAELAEAQSQFLTDASRRLRIPLTMLLTQAGYTLRKIGPVRACESLPVIVAHLQSMNRSTTQLLALTRARHMGQDAPVETFSLGDLARSVMADTLPLTHEEQQDLGWDSGGLVMMLPVIGYPALLREVPSDLVHSAVYCMPADSHVTVWAAANDDTALICVNGTGPGMSTEECVHTFRRFRRAHEGGSHQGKPEGASKDARYTAEGSGLELAIARAYATRSDRHVELADGEPDVHGGVGLSARIHVPLARATASIEHVTIQQP